MLGTDGEDHTDQVWWSPHDLWCAVDEGGRTEGWIGRDWSIDAELQDLRQRSNGWMQAVLVGEDGQRVRAVVTPHAAIAMADYLDDGVRGLWVVRIRTDPEWGQLEAWLVSIDPASTSVGAMATQREATTQRLTGSEDINARLDTGRPAATVALISAPSADGRHDVAAVIANRGDGRLKLVLLAAAMGGPAAAGEVAAQLASPTACAADLILIARGGGGGREWADSEQVCRAVVQASRPVWVAIGHDRDRHLVDRYAARSFASPAAAAAAIVDRHDRAAAHTAVQTATAAASVQPDLQAQVARRRARMLLLAAVVVAIAAAAVVWWLAVGS